MCSFLKTELKHKGLKVYMVKPTELPDCCTMQYWYLIDIMIFDKDQACDESKYILDREMIKLSKQF